MSAQDTAAAVRKESGAARSMTYLPGSPKGGAVIANAYRGTISRICYDCDGMAYLLADAD